MHTLYTSLRLGPLCFALLLLTACNGGGGGGGSAPAPSEDNASAQTDTRPIANAGPDQYADEGTLVSLNGRDSYDPDGDAILYQWRQISGPSVTLSSENDATPSFIAPAGNSWLTFQLIIDDGKNLSIGDTVTINVSALPEPEPEPAPSSPIVIIPTTPEETVPEQTAPEQPAPEESTPDATQPEQPSNEDTSSVTLPPVTDESPAPDEPPATDEEVNPPPAQENTSEETENTTPETELPAPAETVETPEEIVAPAEEESITPEDTSEQTPPTLEEEAVNEAPAINSTPTASAGPDQYAQGLSVVTLDGALSSDAEGDNLTFNWQQLSGTPVNLNGSAIATPSFEAPNINDTLVFSLSVSDGEFVSEADEVQVTIQQINTTPVALAGDDQNVSGFSDVSLSGVNSHDPDGDNLNFSWTQVSGTAVILNDQHNQTPLFTAPNIDDTLIFSLTVNDGTLDSIADTVSINIQRVNTPPVAHAGVDRYVGSLSIVALNGINSLDEDGDALSYRWSQLSGPAVTLNQTDSVQPTFLADTDGELIFSLTVNDSQSDSAADTVKVVVGPIPATNIKVNGTGITWGGNFPTGNNAGCVGELIDQQDCFSGREITHNDNSDGRVGFTFVKYDANGVELDGSASEWQCVQDQVTGLMWEIKTGGNDVVGDEGINDADDRYSWYNSDPATNGGASGSLNNQPGVCYGYDADNPQSYCNTQAFVARMNEIAWCGFADWRMPTRKELLSLVDYGNAKPMIDSDYFPANGTYVWSSTPLALGNTSAWGVNFAYGNSFSISKQNARQIRLVRGGHE